MLCPRTDPWGVDAEETDRTTSARLTSPSRRDRSGTLPGGNFGMQGHARQDEGPQDQPSARRAISTLPIRAAVRFASAEAVPLVVLEWRGFCKPSLRRTSAED
jgi:hypothetical protein